MNLLYIKAKGVNGWKISQTEVLTKFPQKMNVTIPSYGNYVHFLNIGGAGIVAGGFGWLTSGQADGIMVA